MTHIEFPRCLHGAGGKTLIVTNEEDRDRELANGWSLRPVMDAVDPPAAVESAASTDPAPEFNSEPPSGWVEPAAKRGRKPTKH